MAVQVISRSSIQGGVKVKNNYNGEIFNKSPIGILIYDKEGKLIDVNPSALKIFGISKLDAFSIGFFTDLLENILIPQKKETLIEEGLIRFQAPLNFEEIDKGLKKSGTVFVDWTISFIDPGFLVQIQDITESKTLESQSEKKYRSFFEDDITGDFIATLDGEILECNSAFLEIYGFEDCGSACHSDFSQFNHNDWVELIPRLRSESKIQGHQSWHLRPDGEQIHVVFNVVGIFDDFGELVQVKGYVFDDTERRNAEEALMESEEKYHRLFDEDLTGDFITTPDGEVLECNPAFAEIYGFDDCEKALEWNISKSNPFDWPYMVTRLKSEHKIRGYQSWQRRSDGLRIHIVANVVGIFNDVGELIQVKGYVFDDTERKQIEEELTHSQNQIMKILDSVKDGFIALNYYWKFIYVNQSAAQYFGVEPDDLIGQNLWEQFPELKGTTYETAFRRARDEQKIQYFEAQGIRLKDHLFDVSVYPLEEGISVCLRDINMHKKLEK